MLKIYIFLCTGQEIFIRPRRHVLRQKRSGHARTAAILLARLGKKLIRKRAKICLYIITKKIYKIIPVTFFLRRYGFYQPSKKMYGMVFIGLEVISL